MRIITETNVAVAIVTMLTVYVGQETNMYWCRDIGKQSSFSVNVTYVKEVHRVKGMIADCRQSLISTISLFMLVTQLPGYSLVSYHNMKVYSACNTGLPLSIVIVF